MPVCPGPSGWYASIQCSTNFTLDVAQRTIHAMVELVACRFCLLRSPGFPTPSLPALTRGSSNSIRHQVVAYGMWPPLACAMAECPTSCAVSMRPSCTRNSASRPIVVASSGKAAHDHQDTSHATSFFQPGRGAPSCVSWLVARAIVPCARRLATYASLNYSAPRVCVRFGVGIGVLIGSSYLFLIGTEDVYVGSGLIHGIVNGLFAKYITEEPNHGTLAPFIIRYRF
jgi:hypothetical protein